MNETRNCQYGTKDYIEMLYLLEGDIVAFPGVSVVLFSGAQMG